jgi:hypothetical protein
MILFIEVLNNLSNVKLSVYIIAFYIYIISYNNRLDITRANSHYLSARYILGRIYENWN